MTERTNTRALNAFAAMSRIPDDYVLAAERMLQEAEAGISRPQKPMGGFRRFLNSGWGAAVISGIVALAVLAFIIHAGVNPPATYEPPVKPAGSTIEMSTEGVNYTIATELEHYPKGATDITAVLTGKAKGESISDTIRVVSCYADICAIRHPKEGAPKVASQFSGIPVINAGDGGHQHPTQTLTDLLTIRSLKGRLGDLTIGLCGDLKFGRTVHSLIKSLSRYQGIRFVLISPDELRLPDYIRKEVLDREGIPYEEVSDLEDVMDKLDILYMTRVQRERFFNEEDYVRLKDCYILTSKKMAAAKPDMAVLHPLPRVNEIATEVDGDPRAAYFKQAQYGVYVRMALIATLLNLAGREPEC